MTHPAGRLLRRIDRAGGGLTADLLLYALSAAFALLTARTSTLLPHRGWGAIAFWAYLAATLVTVGLFTPAFRPYARRSAREALSWLTWLAACLLPLIVEAAQRAGGRTDRAQDEVLVVEQMGDRLLHSGTPYLGREAILALPPGQRLGAYSPYQPGMAVFGLPRAAFGDFWWTDARVWFAVVTAGALVGAVRMMPRSSLRVRAVQIATVFPICALTLATGGDDLPVLALCLLALALAGKGRYGWSGVAAGAAGALKLFAFPVIVVLVALAVAAVIRSRRVASADPHDGAAQPSTQLSGVGQLSIQGWSADRLTAQPSAADLLSPQPSDTDQLSPLLPGADQLSTRRSSADQPSAQPREADRLSTQHSTTDQPSAQLPGADRLSDQLWADDQLDGAGGRGLRLLVWAVGLPLVVLIPPALVDSDGFVENVLRFPLGHGVVQSPAQSPFPGYLIAQHLPAGRYLAAALLVALAAAIGVRLLRHPPRTATAAALLSGGGLLAAILLMPTTRFGYLLYPAAFLVWAPALRSPTAGRAPQGDPALYRR